MRPMVSYRAAFRRHSEPTYRDLLVGWAILLGTASVAFTIYLSLRFYIGFPFDDQWSVIHDLVGNHGRFSIAQLWAQHNEHRIPFGRLFMQADLYWFRGRNISLFFEIYAMQFAHLLLLIVAVWRFSNWPKWMAGVGIGLAAFAIFWASQYESFLNPIQVIYLQAFSGATASVVSLLFVLNTPNRFTPWIAAVACAAFWAESGLANGLFVWPMVIILAIRFQIGIKLIGALSSFAFLATAIYVYGYHQPPQHANPVESLQKPLLLAQYMLVYFGASWTGLSSVFAQMSAAVGLIAVPFFYLIELVRPKIRPFALAMLSLAIYCLGTGFLTALGRLVFPLELAGSSRYQTAALLFWLFSAVYAIDLVSRISLRSATAACTAVLVFFTTLLPSVRTVFAAAQNYTDRKQPGILPLLAEVRDDQALMTIFPGPDLIFADRSLLRDHHAAFYTDSSYLDLGKPLTSVFTLQRPNRCFGAVDSSRRIVNANHPGWELIGWAWDHQAHRPVEKLVAVTDGLSISGLGVSGRARPDVHHVIPEVSNPDIGWRAYVQGATEFPAIQLYGVVDGGKSACLITPAFAVPTK